MVSVKTIARVLPVVVIFFGWNCQESNLDCTLTDSSCQSYVAQLLYSYRNTASVDIVRSPHGTSAFHSCARLTNGGMRCWGDSTNGKLGYNATANVADGIGLSIINAGNIAIGDTVTQIAGGGIHTCALLSSGSVRCWGAGTNGVLGYNSTANVGDGIGLSIVNAGDVPLGAKALQISASSGHTCALLSTYRIRCWGEGANGKLGYNSTANVGDGAGLSISDAGDVPIGDGLIPVQISAGQNHTCVLTHNGSVRCWGEGANGKLGYNSTANVGDGTGSSIVQAADVPLPGRAVQISTGGETTCALLESGAARCWGLGTFGRLGYNSTNNIGDGAGLTITAAGDIPMGGQVAQISTGNNHSCALLVGGNVRCFGSGGNGRLGYDNTNFVGDGSGLSIIDAGDVPVGETVMQISAGSARTCALLTTGAVRCWAAGVSGKLGHNNTTNIGDGGGLTISAAGDIPVGSTAAEIF